MKSIQLFCMTATVILLEISSAVQVGDPLEGKSAISTEYKARFHKIHQNGINSSEGYIAGVHNMEKNTEEESWQTFAAKCAEVIKGIVAALTGAVTSEPGEKTDLQLDFKNRIYHHDNRIPNSSYFPIGPEDRNDPVVIDEFPEQYPDKSDADDPNNYSNNPGMENPSIDDYDTEDPNVYQTTQDPYQSNRCEGPDGSNHRTNCVNDCNNPGMTETPPYPTWNTPATQEIQRPTEPIMGGPQYAGPYSPDGFDATTPYPFYGSEYQTTPDNRKMPPSGYLGQSPPALDNWKPSPDEQQKFYPGYGGGAAPPGFPYNMPIGTYPPPNSEMKQYGQPCPPTRPESANQMCGTETTENPFNRYDYPQYPEKTGDDDDIDDYDDDDDDKLENEPYEEEPDDTTKQDSAIAPPGDPVVQGRTIEEEVIYPPGNPMEFRPQEETIHDIPNPLPPYGVREDLFKRFPSTTQQPPSSAIYIPITNYQTGGITEGPDEDCCCEDDTYDDESPRQKAICRTACRDLEEARNELKAIFDRIKKKLKCSRRLRC